MKSIGQIRWDFTKARADAAEIDHIAETLRGLSATQMENSMNRLAGAWTGDNAKLFLRKEEQLKTDIRETARSLNDIADDIRRIARRVYEAEMRAYEIACRRNSK